MARPPKTNAPHLYLAKISPNELRLFVMVPVETNKGIERVQATGKWDTPPATFRVEYLLKNGVPTKIPNYATDSIDFQALNCSDCVVSVKIFDGEVNPPILKGECIIELRDVETRNVTLYDDTIAALNVPYVYLTKPDFTNPFGNYFPHVLTLVNDFKEGSDIFESINSGGKIGTDSRSTIKLSSNSTPKLKVILPDTINTIAYLDPEQDNFLEIIVQTPNTSVSAYTDQGKTIIRHKNSDDKPSLIFFGKDETHIIEVSPDFNKKRGKSKKKSKR
ncbi:MAG: hypothetical protein IT258_13235 [Saprospiraceae bacterium]|nr:hypothetical protein [Saprospiraceae bacterium]